MTSDESAAGTPLDDSGVPLSVAVHQVTKTYGSVTALEDVDLTLRRGSVHGLVGENGSGKSTLTKIIAGAVTPDRGAVSINGETLGHVDPRESLARGVRVIFQDLALFPNMTVAENLAFEGDRPLLQPFSGRRTRVRAAHALEQLEMDIDPGARLGDLPTAERQLVAIARTVSSDGRIILMDEPTAALTHREIEQLLSTMRRLSGQGLTFLFISHKLREVAAIADDLTVIRDGRIASSGRCDEYDQERITTLMTGGLLDSKRRTTSVSETEERIMEVRNLSLGSRFRDIDLQLHPGRVLGLAGLVGSGRIEIGLAIAGLLRADQGEIRYRGEIQSDPRANTQLQYVPDDRLTEGLFLDWSVADNIITNNLHAALGRGRTLTTRGIVEVAEDWRRHLSIKAPSVTSPAASLSGGNQQRLLLARALAPAPDVMILNNPTMGVDVGSRVEIHDLIRKVADDGTAILVISDEPAELLTICDDLVFIHEGKVTDRRRADSLDEDGLLDIVSAGGPS